MPAPPLHPGSGVLKPSASRSLQVGDCVQGNSRSTAARFFFEMLVLQTHGVVDAQQDTPFGEITVRPGRKLAL